MKVFVIIASICISACKQQPEHGENKFVLAAQATRLTDRFLIHRLHEGPVRVAYGYQDNNGCDEIFVGKYQQQLLATVSSALKTWLSALSDKKNIAAEFSFTKRSVAPSLDVIDNYKLSTGLFRRAPHFGIIFFCKPGQSHVMIREDRFPTMSLYYGYRVDGELGASERDKYSALTILHELGHVFGLGDTYLDPSKTDRYNYSDGGHSSTIGKQPLSVMSASYVFDPFANEDMHLGEDDIQGLRWLYQAFVEKKDSPCPEQYVYEESTKGCAPRYPLIFLVRQGNFWAILNADSWAKHYLDERDENGQTALHHAALLSKIHGSGIYEYMVNNWQANDNIKDNYGETANDIFYNKITKHRVAMLKKYMQEDMVKAVDILLASLTYENSAGNKLADNKIARQLIAQTALGINHLSNKGRSLLHIAAARKERGLIRFLLQFPEIDINKASSLTGETALHYAVRSTSLLTVRILLEHGASLTAKDQWGRTPSDRAKVLRDDFQKKTEQGKYPAKNKKIKRIEKIINLFNSPKAMTL